jgi:hypothetical protein
MDVQLKITGFFGESNVALLAKARLIGYQHFLVELKIGPSKGTKAHEEFVVKSNIA